MNSIIKTNLFVAIGLSLTTLFSSASHAQSAGQMTLNAGWAHLSPNSSFDTAQISGPGFSATSNAGNKVSQADTFAALIGYYFTDNIGIETFIGVPPRVDLQGTGVLSASTLNPIVQTRAWSPMIIGKYIFGAPTSKIRPFFGAGVSYIWFSGTSMSQPYQQATSLNFSGGSTATLPSSISMSRQFAPVIVAGFNYNLDSHWMVSASAVYIPFSAEMRITTSLPGGSKITSKQKDHFNAVIPTLTIGYRF
jgi:outer membrane protein